MLIISNQDNQLNSLLQKLEGTSYFSITVKKWSEFQDHIIHPGLYKIILVNIDELACHLDIIEEINNKSKHQPIILFGLGEKTLNNDLEYIDLNSFSDVSLQKYCITIRKLWESERKRIQVEIQLFKSENRIDKIISQTPIVIFILDLKGVFKMVFGKFWKDFTTDNEMIIGRSIYDVFKNHENFTELFENTLFKNTQSIVLHLNDKYYSVSLTQIFNKELNQDEVLGLAFDISENIKAEQLLKKAKEIAENANKTKEVFIASMSHEIRNPLNSIVGFTNLLKEMTLTDNSKEYLNNIELSGKRLIDLMNQLLDYSKINAEIHEEESYKEINIKDLIHQCIGISKSAVIEKKLYLKVDFNDNLPKYIISNESKIYQILINLIGNAVKYTNHGGVLLKVYLDETKKYLNICVADTGIGIPDQELNFIFESFYRVKNVVVNNYSGTGLGLSIVKKLIKDLKGEISVKSDLTVGSEFLVSIPFQLSTFSDQNSIPFVNDLFLAYKGKKILIADDNLMNQKLVELLLDNFESELFFASNGIECLEILIENPDVDLILMDIQMPEFDGIETTKKIRSLKEYSFCAVPIVALTANISEKDVKHYKKSGMNDFIAKPIDKNSFLQKCAMILINSNIEEGVSDLLMDFSNLESIGHNNLNRLHQILDLYFYEYFQWKNNITVVLKNNNTMEALKIIHKFKSSLNFVGALEAKNRLVELEKSLEIKSENVSDLLEKLIHLIEKGNNILKSKFKFEYGN